MMKFLRKNQKKILAVFTVGLMIAFIADTGLRRYASPEREGARVLGRVGDRDIRLHDVATAEAELRVLLHQALIETGSPDPQQQFVPILAVLPEGGLQESILRQWLDRPITFALLKEEARQMPVVVNDRGMNLSGVRVRLPDGRIVPFDNAPEELANNVRFAIADYVRVINAFYRAMDALKVSQPLAMHDAIQGRQQIAVRFAPVSARDYLQRAPEPTEQQLQAHFEKWADVASPAFGSPGNPLRFGYRYPERAKLQYIAVPREQVKSVIRARRDDYQWELDAHKYYLQNPREFAASSAQDPLPPAQPATQPATQPSTQPGVRPFAEVREQILDRLMTPQVNLLADEIRRRISETMTADYQAWRQAQPAPTQPASLAGAAPATAPAAAPTTRPVASSLGVPYDSYDYLQVLAQRIQKQYGVLPTTASFGALMTEEQVEEIPGAGRILREAFDLAEPLVPAAQRNEANVLSLYEPSTPRADADGTGYVYRVVQAQPPHAPRALDEVREQLVRDVKTLWGWEQALSEAQRMLEQARASGLDDAAGQRQVVTSGPFSKFSFADIPNVTFDTLASHARFIDESYRLLSQAATATTQPSHSTDRPMRLIELPDDLRVLVAELESVQTNVNLAELDIIRLRQPLMIRQEFQMRMMPRWLSYEGVSARVGFVDPDSPDRTAAVQ